MKVVEKFHGNGIVDTTNETYNCLILKDRFSMLRYFRSICLYKNITNV